MSLPDYYKLLEVRVTATSAEIKSAYRRLAKLFHPDKNPGYLAEEKFKQIQEAYATLINPVRRAKYDAKRNRATTFTKTSSPQQKKQERKSYSFTEEEAKRRQYYQQQYKKTNTTTKTAAPKSNARQTELKYILISVPVAVALLLLIIRIYEKPAFKTDTKITSDTSAYLKSDISTSESPYRGVLGKNISDTNSLFVLKLINRSGYDALVFLENDSHKIIRHHFIANNFQLLAENIPPASYHLYYWLGKEFSYKNFLFDTIIGNFRKSVSIDSAINEICILSAQKDTLNFSLSNKNNQDTLLLKKIFSSGK